MSGTGLGGNSVKEVKVSKLGNNRCACHTLRLIVKNCEDIVPSLSDHKVDHKVERFRRSAVDSKFCECQKRAGVPSGTAGTPDTR